MSNKNNGLAAHSSNNASVTNTAILPLYLKDSKICFHLKQDLALSIFIPYITRFEFVKESSINLRDKIEVDN